jgi:hypothetical protein
MNAFVGICHVLVSVEVLCAATLGVSTNDALIITVKNNAIVMAIVLSFIFCIFFSPFLFSVITVFRTK